MIRRQTDLVPIAMWIKSIIATLFGLDKKLPILTLACIAGMVIVSLIPTAGSAEGNVFLAFTPFVQNALHIPAYALLCLLISVSLVTFNVSIRKAGFIGVLFCIAFAACDQALQSFVLTREASVVALGLNLTGIFVGYVVMQYYLHVTFIGRWE